MNETTAQKMICESAILVGDACFLTEPYLRYMTEKQAKHWLEIGTYNNVHTTSAELGILEHSLQNYLTKLSTNDFAIVDLGCGDGLKGAHLINLLFHYRYSVTNYVAIDVNETLANAALKNVTTKTLLSRENCAYLQSKFEDMKDYIQHLIGMKLPKQIIYLFLGNTYNNFDSQTIIHYLQKIVNVSSTLVIGAKYRKFGTQNEIDQFIREYTSFGSQFTYEFGRLLGLDNKSMKRSVRYNFEKQCIEIWLEISRPSSFMIKSGFSKIRKFLVARSYRPSLEEIISGLLPWFDTVSQGTQSTNDIILYCYRK